MNPMPDPRLHQFAEAEYRHELQAHKRHLLRRFDVLKRVEMGVLATPTTPPPAPPSTPVSLVVKVAGGPTTRRIVRDPDGLIEAVVDEPIDAPIRRVVRDTDGLITAIIDEPAKS